MAGKRQATSNLNHDNWDQEEEPEERGHFRTATEDELKSRLFKKGRRKVTGGPSAGTDDSKSETKSVFSGFSGFSTTNAISGAKSPFSFLANLPAPTATSTAATTSPATKPMFSFMASSSSTLATEKPPTTSISGKIGSISTTKESTSTTDGAKPTAVNFGNISSSKKANTEPLSSVFKTSPARSKPANTTANDHQYRESVADLNRALVKYLQEKVNMNAYCILSPVFENYELHIKELNNSKEGESAQSSDKKSAPLASVVPTVSSMSPPAKPTTTFSFGKPSTPIGGSTSPFAKKPNCTVTSGGTTTTTSPTPLVSFGTTSVSAKPAAPITSIFSFTPKPAVNETKAAGDAPKPGLFSFGATESSTKKSELLFGVIKDDVSSPFSTKKDDVSTFAAKKDISSPFATKKDDVSPFAAKKVDISSPFAAKKDDLSAFSTKKDETVGTAPKTNGFSFGLKSNTDDKPSCSIFSGFSKPGESATKGFSFSSGATPFSFGNIPPPGAAATSAADQEAQDEEDKPPKVEFKQVVEDDAIYSKRCKVFVKKDNEYGDRGIGTLYLKPIKDSEKTQLLVRADTNLGNILVNLILSEGIPCQRMGKNNVMMVCKATPEERKVGSMLLRVKTGEEADDLLNKIKQHTK